MGIKIAAYPKCYEYDIGLHHTMSVFDWIEIARQELEVDGLEMYDRFFTSLDQSYLEKVAKTVEDAGFVVPMLICSPDFTNPDPAERQRAIEYEAKMIEVAYLLGGPGTVCRILSGQQRPQVSRDQGIKWVVEAINQVIPVAKQHGVILGMENHYKDSQWSNPEFAMQMDIFLEIVNSITDRESFGVQFDPSNSIVAGEDPIVLLAKIKDRVVSMHASDRYIKDGDGSWEDVQSSHDRLGYASNLYHGVVGKGLNDYDRIFSILSEAGFKGWISIEDGLNGLEEIRESCVFLRNMSKKYFNSFGETNKCNQ